MGSKKATSKISPVWKKSKKGRDEAMNLNDYQQMSSRTAKKHDGELTNYGLGIAGESGEVADLIKKSVFHGHDINQEDIKKELGDVLWYVSQIARLAGLSLEEVATANIEKLYKRYPDGFSIEKSINRTEYKGG
jgi:NTP pyrophosphatase (non-canonical NTP hydrolase)